MFATQTRSTLISGVLHGGAILLILAVTGVKAPLIHQLHDILVVPPDIGSYYKTALASADHGGGGGGQHAATPASIGNAPRFAVRQISIPLVDPNSHVPILSVEPTLIGDPNMQPEIKYADYGVPDGVFGTRSAGKGSGGGWGDGEGTGNGNGKGPGEGPGEGGNRGGGDVAFNGAGMGSITAPELLVKTEPEYSEEARKARLQGTVLLRIEVDTSGFARNISVSHSLGLGLDDRAMEAVKKWKFKPGRLNGKPTTLVAYVEVNFRLL